MTIEFLSREEAVDMFASTFDNNLRNHKGDIIEAFSIEEKILEHKGKDILVTLHHVLSCMSECDDWDSVEYAIDMRSTYITDTLCDTLCDTGELTPLEKDMMFGHANWRKIILFLSNFVVSRIRKVKARDIFSYDTGSYYYYQILNHKDKVIGYINVDDGSMAAVLWRLDAQWLSNYKELMKV